MASLLASIPLQLICQLVVTESPGTTLTTDSANSPQNVSSQLSHSESSTFPDGYVFYPKIGFAYKVHNDSVRWNVARKRCDTEGANLAVIDSWEKFDYLSHQRQSKGLTHVGIHDLYSEDEWVSVKNGSTLDFVPWATGEPTLNGGAHCVMVKSQSGGLGNFGCANFQGDFVCEIPIQDGYASRGDQALVHGAPN